MFPQASKLIVYGITAALSLLIAAMVLRLHHADWSVPFSYGGDGVAGAALAKTMIDHGWFFENPQLGAPGEFNQYDFPMSESLHYAVMKLLALVRPQFGFVMNACFLLTFPFTALTTLLALRQFKVSTLPAVVVSLLYAFAPYHFNRGMDHFALACYYVLPLSLMLAMWVYLGQASQSRSRIGWSLLICVMQASVGVYYAFFSCYFLLVSGIAVSLQRRRAHGLLMAGLFIGVTGAAVLANLAPSILYRRANVATNLVGQRTPVQAEVYGLKISQLLLPLENHRWGLMRQIHQKYNQHTMWVNENSMGTLGLVASAGFLYLLVRLLFRRQAREGDNILNGLAILNLSAVLLGTIGGLGFLFNLYVSPQIRCYNRLSIFIALFALAAVGVLLTRMTQLANTPWRQWLMAGGLAALLPLGVLDQTSRNHKPRYAGWKETCEGDREFVARIEQAVPAGSAIYQLPYVDYPEPRRIHNLPGYQHFRPYLQSSKSSGLRWSYGCAKGRAGDVWNIQLTRKPVAEQVRDLALLDFAGIYIDRRGYVDAGAELENELKQLLGQEPMIDRWTQRSFFTLTDYASMLRQQLTSEQWQHERTLALGPLRPMKSHDLSVELVFNNEMVEKDSGWYSRSTDPFLIYQTKPQHVYGVEIVCELRPLLYDYAHAQFFWREEGRNEFIEEERNTSMVIDPTVAKQTFTIWIDDTIDQLRIDPDRKACYFKLHAVRLLTPLDAVSEGTSRLASKPGP